MYNLRHKHSTVRLTAAEATEASRGNSSSSSIHTVTMNRIKMKLYMNLLEENLFQFVGSGGRFFFFCVSYTMLFQYLIFGIAVETSNKKQQLWVRKKNQQKK